MFSGIGGHASGRLLTNCLKSNVTNKNIVTFKWKSKVASDF
jgi:hypothetical protein